MDCSWVLDRAIGALRTDGFTARVDVAHPELGLRDVKLGGLNQAGSLMCVRREADGDVPPAWPLAVADSYVRGADLVASYHATNEWPYSPTIYWRAGSPDPIEGLISSLSVLVSVQTHLLDTWPRIAITSQLVCDEVLRVKPRRTEEKVQTERLTRDCTIRPAASTCCILRRLADAPISYAEFMPASDFRELQVRCNTDGQWHVQWGLFAEFLEKGVIRRARLQSAFLTRDNDLELAAACCEAMERGELPLTT